MKGNKGRNPRSKRLKFRFLPVTTINIIKKKKISKKSCYENEDKGSRIQELLSMSQQIPGLPLDTEKLR